MKIAILLASYKGENYIREQIQSLLEQTVTDTKILIRDDQSPDRTFEIEQEFEKNYPDKIHAYGAPDADSPSFPSGHTAAAFSLATSLSITYPKWYVIAPSAVWACGVGFARMNQGVHYPSDVVAGAAIGVGCAFVNVYVNRWLNKVLFGRQIK